MIPLQLRTAIPASVVLISALWALRQVQDPDTFWHIRAGELLWRTWSFVTADPYSASAERPWIFNQWLPQLIMAKAYEFAGLPGVAWLLSVATVAVIVTLWWVCRRRAGLLVTSIVLALTLVGMAGSLSPRPQVVTFAFSIVVTGVWLDTIKDGRPRWWLVALSWVWACSHGLWFVGPVIGLTAVVGMALAGAAGRRQLAHLAAVPILSAAVAAITPVGLALLRSPFQVGDVTHFITEWQPPETTYVPFVIVLILLLPSIVVVSRRPARASIPTALLMCLALAFAFTYARTIAVAAAIAGPMAAASLQSLIPLTREVVTRRERASTAVGAFVGLGIAAVLASSVAGQPGLGPNQLSPVLATIPSGSVVCNEWEDGGWLILEHPNVRVTQDPRAELYTPGHIQSYLDFIHGAPGWQDYPKRNRCEFALLDDHLPVTESLRLQERWTVVESLGGATLLKAPAKRE